MSYVLNALRKSDNARSAARQAGTEETLPPPKPEESTSRTTWRAWLIALLIPVSMGLYFSQAHLPQTPTLVSEQTNQGGQVAPLATAPCVAEIPLAVRPIASLPPTQAPEQVAAPDYQTQFNGQLIQVMDGCHLQVKDHKNHILSIELAGIRCPSPQTPLGKEAQIFSNLFVQKGLRVAVLQKQPSHALLADIFDLDNTLLNRMLVRQGLADTTEDRFQPDKQAARIDQKCMWQNTERSHNTLSPTLTGQP